MLSSASPAQVAVDRFTLHAIRHIAVFPLHSCPCGSTIRPCKRIEALSSLSVLDVDQEAQALAEQVLGAKAVPAEYPDDALHVAVAAVNGMDVLVTWNFAHLNNPIARMRIRDIVEGNGYRCPEVCSPEELLEMDL